MSVKKILYIMMICAFFSSCKFDNAVEGLNVPPEIIGKWGIEDAAKKKNEVIDISPTHLIMAGLYFKLQKVEYTAYSGVKVSANGTKVRQEGSIKTSGPGKSGVFCDYSVTADGKLELLGKDDGSTILTSPLQIQLTRISAGND